MTFTISDGPLTMATADHIATITLNRPDAGNSIDVPMAKALLEAAMVCAADNSIRCVLLTGAGKMFCAGGDITAMSSAGEKLPELIATITAYLHEAIAQFLYMEKPLVTAVNGTAAGAGLALSILGDIAVAGRSAKFTPAYSRIGLSPDAGTSWLLPRLMGMRPAQEFVLTNQRVTADEAAALGMVTRVVDDSALMEETRVLAAKLAAAPTRALGRTRALLLSSFETSVEIHLARERKAVIECVNCSEGREGVAAFVAKREPDFLGQGTHSA